MGTHKPIQSHTTSTRLRPFPSSITPPTWTPTAHEPAATHQALRRPTMLDHHPAVVAHPPPLSLDLGAHRPSISEGKKKNPSPTQQPAPSAPAPPPLQSVLSAAKATHFLLQAETGQPGWTQHGPTCEPP